jgi:hypothetical protein
MNVTVAHRDSPRTTELREAIARQRHHRVARINAVGDERACAEKCRLTLA